MSRQDDLKKLITENYRHLQILKQQEARYGSLNVPTYIVTQIQEREAEIEKLQTELATIEETEKESPQPKLAASPAVAASVTPTVAAGPQMVARRAQLRIFLCHATEDKPRVTELYRHLKDAGYRPWLDKYDLLPGRKWQPVIKKIITDLENIVLVCLSNNSITKRGMVQQEIKWALDILERMPEETIYLIPVRLEACQAPDPLSDLQWVDLFEPEGFDYLTRALDYEIGRRQAVPEAEPVTPPPPAETYIIPEGLKQIGLGLDKAVVGYEIGSQSGKGENEDNYWPHPDDLNQYHPVDCLIAGRLYIVADGVFYGLSGSEASYLAAQAVAKTYLFLSNQKDSTF